MRRSGEINYKTLFRDNFPVPEQVYFITRMIDNNSLSRLNLFQTPQELYNNYLVRLNASGYQENTFASYGYDAALTCALTLNASIVILKQQNFTLKDFNYSQSNVRNVFVDIMKGISFAGMTVSYALLPERNA